MKKKNAYDVRICMYCLSYLSTAKKDFSKDDLDKLLSQAQSFNSKNNITGYLYFNKNIFLQYLEGNKGTVQKLMDKIKADERHTVNLVVDSEDLKKRRFPEWNMHSINNTKFSAVFLENIWEEYFNWSINSSRPHDRYATQIWRVVERIAALKYPEK